MVLGKLPVPRRLINLDDNRAKAYCAYSVCVSGGAVSLICHFSFSFLPIWKTARYRLKHCLKGLLNPKQPTNQNTIKMKMPTRNP